MVDAAERQLEQLREQRAQADALLAAGKLEEAEAVLRCAEKGVLLPPPLFLPLPVFSGPA
jgi:hypothetical protein